VNPRNRRVVDPGKIEQNMREICSALPEHVRALAVVKADGYGHGALQTARAAIHGGASMLAVASVDEGTALRDAGIRIPILVLGAVTGYDVKQGVEAGLIQTVCSPDMVRMCESAATETGKQTEVHLKIDTGMGRIGIRTEKEKEQVMKTLRECPHVKLGGAFTHFADADGGEDGERYTEQQFRRFLELTDGLPEDVIRHCCNSAAIHRHPEMHLDMVRAGVVLYGLQPSTDLKNPGKLIPVLTLKTIIDHIKNAHAGDCISYGREFVADHCIRVATIPIGYADGLWRSNFHNHMVVEVEGKLAPIVGRVCMDQCMIDVTDIPEAVVNSKVTVYGVSASTSVDHIAEANGTINYEIVCALGERVPRVYKKAGQTVAIVDNIV
jgi:alanine racemase